MKLSIEQSLYAKYHSRVPCGARGLKRISPALRSAGITSRPVRGAWIETTTRGRSCQPTWSRPVRGAWIETCRNPLSARGRTCRAPHGARGLKPPPEPLDLRPGESRPVRGAWGRSRSDDAFVYVPILLPRRDDSDVIQDLQEGDGHRPRFLTQVCTRLIAHCASTEAASTRLCPLRRHGPRLWRRSGGMPLSK